jgi:hypothetical protein
VAGQDGGGVCGLVDGRDHSEEREGCHGQGDVAFPGSAADIYCTQNALQSYFLELVNDDKIVVFAPVGGDVTMAKDPPRSARRGARGETRTVRRNDLDCPWRAGAGYRSAAGAEMRLISTLR